MITVHCGDAIEVMRSITGDSIDAVVTDPPYGISFMGKQWDQPDQYGSTVKNGTPGLHGRVGRHDPRDYTAKPGAMEAGRYDLSPSAMRNFQAWCTAWAAECLRILKPGGHLLSFGGSRTWHRLAAAVEDAGFEIRDSIAWLNGSGFPKSLDVSKAIDKAAGAERAVVGVGPDHAKRTAAASGTISREGGAAPVGQILTSPATDAARQWQGWGTALKPGFEPIVVARKPLAGTVASNVLKHGTGALNIDGCRVGENGGARRSAADAEAHGRPNAVLGKGLDLANPAPRVDGLGRWPTNVVLDDATAAELDEQTGVTRSPQPYVYDGKPETERSAYGRGIGYGHHDAEYGDTGGASRFFPVFRYQAKAPTRERPRVGGVAHPTVKPLELMRWLVRLVTPPGGVVLDPFAGSGTTGEACLLEGFRAVLIERETDYIPLIHARIARPELEGQAS